MYAISKKKKLKKFLGSNWLNLLDNRYDNISITYSAFPHLSRFKLGKALNHKIIIFNYSTQKH
jgi:hypothetical protein